MTASGRPSLQPPQLGFSLPGLKKLLSLRATPEAGCAAICTRAEEKIKDIDEKIGSLTAMQEARSTLVTECSGEGLLTDCPILEALDAQEVIPFLFATSYTTPIPEYA
jgi:MerR-like DNA binding protein